MQAFDNRTDEWLPAWLLEEAKVEGDQHDGSVVVAAKRTRGPQGTEVARTAAMVDGCTIIKVGWCPCGSFSICGRVLSAMLVVVDCPGQPHGHVDLCKP